jgi:predicted dehydrogenase
MIRVGVVGCGRWGLEHLTGYEQVEDVSVVAVCDVDPEAAERAAARYGAPRWYTRYQEMLAREEFDLVSVCTLPASHRDITVAAFAAGANVLCEKPLAMNLTEAKEMAAAAERAGKFLTVGYENRFSEAAQYLHQFVAAGKMGRPVYTRCWLYCEFPWWGRAYNVMSSLCGGGTVTSGGIHALDLALWVAGYPQPTTVSATMAQTFPRKRRASAPSPETVDIYDVEDLASAHIRFADGSWMTLESAAGGIDTLDPDPRTFSMNTILGFTMAGEDATVDFAPLRVLVNDESGAIVDATPPDVPAWDIPRAMLAEIAAVAAAVREGRSPVVRSDQALVLEQIRDAIYRSARAGTEVSVDPIGDLSEVVITAPSGLVTEGMV